MSCLLSELLRLSHFVIVPNVTNNYLAHKISKGYRHVNSLFVVISQYFCPSPMFKYESTNKFVGTNIARRRVNVAQIGNIGK